VRSYGARAGNLYDRRMWETVLSEGRNFIIFDSARIEVLGAIESC
jgi:hypothetical protein